MLACLKLACNNNFPSQVDLRHNKFCREDAKTTNRTKQTFCSNHLHRRHIENTHNEYTKQKRKNYHHRKFDFV